MKGGGGGGGGGGQNFLRQRFISLSLVPTTVNA